MFHVAWMHYVMLACVMAGIGWDAPDSDDDDESPSLSDAMFGFGAVPLGGAAFIVAPGSIPCRGCRAGCGDCDDDDYFRCERCDADERVDTRAYYFSPYQPKMRICYGCVLELD